MRRVGIKAAATVLLSACATLSKEHCQTKRWDRIGAQDAERLRPPEFVVEHFETCGPGVVDEVKYREGYATEMKNLCTQVDAFVFASENRPENLACVQTGETKAAYRAGAKYFANERSIQFLRERHADAVETEKAEEVAHAHDSTTKSIVHSIFGGSRKVSGDFLDRIEETEKEQDEIRKAFAGAILRARYLRNLAPDFYFLDSAMPVPVVVAPAAPKKLP